MMCCSTAVTLGLSASEYFVTEGLGKRVCVVLMSGRIERLVDYEVELGGGSASSKFAIPHIQHERIL